MERSLKDKTIEKIIRAKMNNWIKTFETDELKTLVKNNYILTGGAITSLLLGEKPNDFDLYFKTPESALAVANYYTAKMVASGKVSRIESRIEGDSVKIFIKSAGVAGSNTDKPDEGYDYFESTDGADIESYLDKQLLKKDIRPNVYEPLMVTSNAITLTNDIQIIVRFTGSPEEIHKNYDFLHTTNYFTDVDGLVLNLPAVRAVMTKELKYVGSRYPICSLFRIRKFIQRGWSITAGEILKISWDINKLDLESFEVLKDQLVGVDAAYFHQLLNILKEGNRVLDRTYLVELIERVFDESDQIGPEFNIDLGE